MIIRCPHCEHVRSVIESNIPPTAEYAKCPKCGHRFRFRTVEQAPPVEEPAPKRPERPEQTAPSMNPHAPPSATDIWDAVESLHQKWNNQMDQQVTEVVTPQPLRPDSGQQEPHGHQVSPHHPPQETTEGAQASPHTLPECAKNLPLFSLPETSPLDQEKAPAEDAETMPPASDTPRHRQEQADSAAQQGETTELSLSPESHEDDLPEHGQQLKPPFFSYADSDLTPEEKVEQDMRLLQAEGYRPSRDLGNIDDHIALLDAQQEEISTPDSTPWENPREHGWLRAFTRTIHGAMFSAPEFFMGLSPTGPLAPGYLFFLLLGYVAILCAALWRHALGNILAAAQPAGPLALPVLLLLAPVALGLALLLLTGCIRVILQLFAPEKALFPLLFKLISYSVAPLILSIIPFVGPPVGLLWFLTVFTIGCRHRLELSWPLVLLGVLPPVVIVIGLLAFSLL